MTYWKRFSLCCPRNRSTDAEASQKKWRSILESKRFMERRMSLQKSRRKILVAYHCDCRKLPRLLPESRFEGDEEIVYLHYNTNRPSMTCDGLVCFPDQDWIHVLNPSTRQLRRFPTDLNTHNYKLIFLVGKWWTRNLGEWLILFGRDWSIGFGRDKVTGSFKIVKICYSHPGKECAVLDVETGDWRKLGLPCYVHRLRNHSACVNGSIYWLYKDGDYKLLALDLHKEEFHDVSVPAMFLTWNTQIVNLEGRLAIAQVGPDWILEILTMDAEEERWSKTYSITLPPTSESDSLVRRFRPLALSKQGNLVLCDNCNMLSKYYPETDKIHCLSSHSHYYRVISPYLENLVPLPLKSSHPVPIPLDAELWVKCPFFKPVSSNWKSYIFQLRESRITYYLLVFIVFASYVIFILFLYSARLEHDYW